MPKTETNNKKQQEKHIRYMLPVELELRGIPDNKLLTSQKGLNFPYIITGKEQQDIADCAKKEHISFDEELKKTFERHFNTSEEAFLTLASFKTQYRQYKDYSYHFKLTGAVRLAKEGEQGFVPKIEKKLKPWFTKLRLRHVLIIFSILAVVAVLSVLIFTH